MIFGKVDSSLEARIPLFIEDISGQSHPIEAIIDTGYSGFLSLPAPLIASLGLAWLEDHEAILADGSVQYLNVYSAVIIWDSQSRPIHVTAVGEDILVGMKLLEGYELRIRVVAGGLVLIDAVP